MTYFPAVASIALATCVSACGGHVDGADRGAGASHSATTTAHRWIRDVQFQRAGIPGIPEASPDDEDDLIFLPRQRVELDVGLSGAPRDISLRVVWRGPGDLLIGEQWQTVADAHGTLRFTGSQLPSWRRRGWTPGDYHAELWVGEQKFADYPFRVDANATTASR